MSFNILVVDDTKFMRKMLTDILKQYGYQVVGEAENGRQAVQRYEELRPDVVLMDITMPEMDGIDAMKEIRRIDSDAVVLICSAMSQQDLISDALKAGANGYVMKPFKPNRVNEIIRKYGFRRPNHDPTPKAAEAPVEERPEQPVAVPAPEPELEATVATESPEPTAAASDAEPRVVSEPGQVPEEALAEESVELPAVALEPESEPVLEPEEHRLEQSELEAMPEAETMPEADPVAEAEEVAAEESAELPAVSPELELASETDAEEESLELAAVEPEPESQAALIEEISVLAAVETPVALEPESTQEEELQEPSSLAGSDEAAEAGDLVLPLSILEQPSVAELSLDELNELTLELAAAEPDESEALQADSVPALETDADLDPEPEPVLEQEVEPALDLAAEPDLEPELVETQPQPESAANEPKPVQDWMEAGKRAFKTVEGGKIINLFRGNGPMKNFTSSYMCNWNEEVNGEMSQFLVIATEAENKISIEVLSNGNERQTIHLSIDGFNQLGAWLQDKLSNGAPSVRELSKRENY